MRIEFSEQFRVPIEVAYSHFPTPPDWPRLFAFGQPVVSLQDGWYAIPLRRAPIRLIARVDINEPNRRVHWIFRGFWRGEGEVNFARYDAGVVISGFEEVHMPHALGIGPWVERNYLQRPFERLWESGWQKLRQLSTKTSEVQIVA